MRPLEGQPGMALVLVLVFSATLLVLGAALLTFALNDAIIAGYQAEEAALYYIAEAGLEAGIAALHRDFGHTAPMSGTLNGGHFQVSFDLQDTGACKVISEAVLDRWQKKLTVIVQHNPENGILHVLWLKPD